MEQLHIPVVLGTARADRKSKAVADAVQQMIEQSEQHTSELVDVRSHVTEAVTVPPWGDGGANEKPTEWQEIVHRSQALVLVIPEYNHGYPGELKLLLDSLWEDYKGRPVGLVGVSAGRLGGARVIEHIKPVLIELYLHPIHTAVQFGNVKEAFAPDGALVQEQAAAAIEEMLGELTETASALAPLRA